jgi:hypothetical protein
MATRREFISWLMLMPKIRHSFASSKTDGADTTVVLPSHWNAPLQYTDVNDAPSGTAAVIRKTLTADTTYNVTAVGNDTTGDGSVATPWLTLQHAYDTITSSYDLAGHHATIQVGPGTYDGVMYTNSWIGGGFIDFNGDFATPSNVVIDAKGAFCFKTLYSTLPGISLIQGFKLIDSVGGGGGIVVAEAAPIQIDGIEWGSFAGGAHVAIAGGGSVLFQAGATLRISGGAKWHVYCEAQGLYDIEDSTITITGTPNFTDAFARCLTNAAIYWTGNTIVGSATGIRYIVLEGGQITTANSGSLPGDQSGQIIDSASGFTDTLSQISTTPIYVLGVVSSGTITPYPANGSFQAYTNNGAHTLAPSGSVVGQYWLDITNGASAGVITTSGWTKVITTLGALNTTVGNKFRLLATIGLAGSQLTIYPLQ